MYKIKVLLLVASLVLVTALMPLITFAQTQKDSSYSVQYEKINLKDGSRYLVKRLKEKVILLFLFNNPQKKLNYYKTLLTIRLAELKFIVDNKDISNIQVASQRYFTTAGQLTELIKSKSELASNKEGVQTLFAEHILVIESLGKAYPDTTAEWRLLRDDANYLKDYSQSLN